ncbi:hypothetical protein [Rufibacter roseus]|uniref:Uncharacterized protein n=1 Tax=Rufibacter roseus TaxID=1567108 RepID=A0ABW2DSY3_9BACT|nr:hypothetical protein [Rufibacter roseus]
MGRKPKKIADATAPADSRYLIWEKYEDLSNSKKELLRQKFVERTELKERSFYLKLRSNDLATSELEFFAEMFGCSSRELYREKPPIKESIHDIARKLSGKGTPEQAVLVA